MARQYVGPTATESILRLVKGLLDGKQDKMDEITAEEVQTMWNEAGTTETP